MFSAQCLLLFHLQIPREGKKTEVEFHRRPPGAAFHPWSSCKAGFIIRIKLLGCWQGWAEPTKNSLMFPKFLSKST